MQKLKAAVIGVGNMGKHHARNYFESNKSNLVAVSDLNEELGIEIARKFNAKFYSNYHELLSEEKPDLVSVVVPTKFHLRAGLDVLNAGAHLLLEKPISSTIDEGWQLINKATEKKLKFTVGHIERFNPVVTLLKKLIDSGELGSISSIVAKRVGTAPPQIKDANVVIDLAVHDIDIISYLMGRQPDKVFASGGKAITEDREDHAEIFLFYGQVGCFVQVNWLTPIKIRTLSVTADKGYVELNYATQKLAVYKSVQHKEVNSFGEFTTRYGEPEFNETSGSGVEPLKLEIESFLDSIIQGKDPSVSGKDGLKALMIAEKAIQSIRKGETIQ